jgi:hypothetical protein
LVVLIERPTLADVPIYGAALAAVRHECSIRRTEIRKFSPARTSKADRPRSEGRTARARSRRFAHYRRNGGLERIEAAHARMMLKTPLCPRRSAERRAGLYDGTNVRLRTPLEPNIFIVGSVRVA